MDKMTLVCISFFVLLVSSFLAYQYISRRYATDAGGHFWRRASFDPVTMIVISAVFVVSASIMAYCYLYKNDLFIRSIMNAGVFTWLAILGYIDFKEKIIPNSMILVGLVAWAILVMVDIFLGGTPVRSILTYSCIGGFAVGGVLLIISLIAKSALGMGDVKMFFVVGLLYGLNDTYSILLFTIFIMAIFSIILLLSKKATRKTSLPMAPFTVVGFIVSILAGL